MLFLWLLSFIPRRPRDIDSGYLGCSLVKCFNNNSPPVFSNRRQALLYVAIVVGETSLVALNERLHPKTKPLYQNPSEGLEFEIPSSQNDLGILQRSRSKLYRDPSRNPTVEEVTEAAKGLDELKLVLDELDRFFLAELSNKKSKWRETGALEIENRLAPLSAKLSSVAETLARAPLSAEFRAAIGWPWGMCGWRRGCGPLADAEKALSTLRAQLGMLSLEEARFLVDVARRSVDEARAVCFAHGPPLWPRGKALGASGPYLPTAELSAVLDGDPEGAFESEALASFQAWRNGDSDLASEAVSSAQRNLGLRLRLGVESDSF